MISSILLIKNIYSSVVYTLKEQKYLLNTNII